MNANPVTAHLTPFVPGHEIRNNGRVQYPHAEAIELQKLCMKLARQPKVRALDLAALARAWDILEDRKRILRGKPLPGQLRPDMMPVKRARISSQKFIELAKANAGAFTADDEPDTETPTTTPPSPSKKELDTSPKSTP